jgi:hypothetical protein
MIPGADRESLAGRASEADVAAVVQAFHRAFLAAAAAAALAAFTASRIPRIKLWEPTAKALPSRPEVD